MCPPESFPPQHGTSSSSSRHRATPKFIPDSPLAIKAYELAASHLPPAILNHSFRVFLYAKYFHETPDVFSTLPYPAVVSAATSINLTHLFVACILHDVGASETNFNGIQRFEVCGADAAITLMSSFTGLSTPEERLDVWSAISMHSSPGIAERYSALSRLVRIAVTTDFGAGNLISDEMKNEIEVGLPRQQIEKVLGDAVVKQALEKEGAAAQIFKAPKNSWPGGLVQSWKDDIKRGDLPADGVNRAF